MNGEVNLPQTLSPPKTASAKEPNDGSFPEKSRTVYVWRNYIDCGPARNHLNQHLFRQRTPAYMVKFSGSRECQPLYRQVKMQEGRDDVFTEGHPLEDEERASEWPRSTTYTSPFESASQLICLDFKSQRWTDSFWSRGSWCVRTGPDHNGKGIMHSVLVIIWRTSDRR